MSIAEKEKPTQYSKYIRTRMARSLGHLNTVKAMIDDGAALSDVMMQLSAVRASLAGTSNKLMAEELEKALQEVSDGGDTARVTEVYQIVEKYFGK